MTREQRDEISIFAYICEQRSAVEYRHLISYTRSSKYCRLQNIAVCRSQDVGKDGSFPAYSCFSTMDSFRFEEIVSGNGAFPDLPTSKTCKSGNVEKKPRKTWRLGSQTWRFPKYVLNENKNGRFLVSRYSLPYLCTYCILLLHILKSQFLFRCRREAPV